VEDADSQKYLNKKFQKTAKRLDELLRGSISYFLRSRKIIQY
jgi:hypothetical protein